jgi:hypothetical protein
MREARDIFARLDRMIAELGEQLSPESAAPALSKSPKASNRTQDWTVLDSAKTPLSNAKPLADQGVGQFGQFGQREGDVPGKPPAPRLPEDEGGGSRVEFSSLLSKMSNLSKAAEKRGSPIGQRENATVQTVQSIAAIAMTMPSLPSFDAIYDEGDLDPWLDADRIEAVRRWLARVREMQQDSGFAFFQDKPSSDAPALPIAKSGAR